MGAFGKDRETLKKVTSLREAANASRQRRPQSSGGGGWQRFNNQFKPNTTTPDTIRFVPGEYAFTQVLDDGKTQTIALPYFCYTEHFDGRTNTSTLCSSGPYAAYKDKRDPCIGCDIFWETGGKKGGRMSRRDMKVFTVLNYGTFHEIDQLDNKGQVKVNDKTNKPYTQWVKCVGRRCDACAAQKPTKKGHLQHYSVGYGHFSQIKDYAKEIGKCCRACGGKNTIQEVAFLCPNCKEAVIDLATTHLDQEEINKMIDSDVACPHCRQAVLLEEVIECSGCPTPERASIFDVDISLKKTAGDANSNQSSLLFTGFGSVSQVDPVYEAKPMDLEKMFQPTPLDQQADKFKAPMPAPTPRQPVPASQVARSWSGGGGGGGGPSTASNINQADAQTGPAVTVTVGAGGSGGSIFKR